MKTFSYRNLDPGPASLTYRLMLALACLLTTGIAVASGEQTTQDPHYNEAGFFDIHVCNWPDRPVFLMPLFSTTQGDAIRSIEVLTPDRQSLVQLDLSRYRSITQENKPDKRVFINQIDVPPKAENGWYSARITLDDGRRFTAKDYVVISRLTQAGGQVPADGAEVVLPDVLRWKPVPGARFYQVFIRDLWDDDRLIHTSKLLGSPALELPPGLLEPGGYYSWIIHARDTNEDAMLGDFNHGSLNRAATFTVIN